MTTNTSRSAVVVWCIAFALVLMWSYIDATDRFTWWLEVMPALIAVVVLAATRLTFPLTPLCYWAILVHAAILMVGGHYTYAHVPLFDWVKEPFGWQRNNYDKLGHLAQGFVPALVAREILLRVSPLKPGGWLNYLVVSVCLAISAFYELVEWWVALLSGSGADAFLGSQGDIWDTQSDMACALVGAIVAVALLGRVQDRQLVRLPR